MGIQGLMSYVCNNRSFFHDVQLRNTKLIIDGNNLYHKLYFDSGLDLVRGGDYDAFTDILSQFFESLSACHIRAYVLFDGGCDVSDKKLETQKQRFYDKIKVAQSLSAERGGTLLPFLVREVCLQALRKLGVPFLQCFSEADKEIVALANRWHCPVLTFDSDFCIFDLQAGYCPLNSFQWKNIGTMQGTNNCYIPARCFLAQRFCAYFNNMNVSLLPLFAVLAGNDYISLPALEAFFRNVNMPVGYIGHGGNKHVRIQGLLNWLSRFADVKEAMENVLKYLKLNDRESVRQLLCSAMEEYKLHDVWSLEQFFQGGVYLCPTAVQLGVPDWVQDALAKGSLSPLLSDALVLKRVFLHIQVEDLRRQSAHLITQPVRKVIYALLLNVYQSGKPELHGLKGTPRICVEEYDRIEASPKRSKVEVTVVSNDSKEDITLQNMPKLPVATRLKLLLHTAELRVSDLEPVAPEHQLTLAAICYWIAHADPKVKPHHFKAVLMGIVYGQFYKSLKTPEFQSVCAQMERIRSGCFEYERLNLEDIHILCQWQCCLQMLLALNQLLCTPLPEPDITRIYSGSLVYRLVQTLKTSPSAEDLFKSCPPMQRLYQKFISAVTSSVPTDCFHRSTTSASNKWKKTEPGKRSPNMTVGETTNQFASLALDD